MRPAALVLCLAFLSGWAAAACDELAYPVRLSIQEFGTAHFTDFLIDVEQNRAELTGGVCLSGAGGDWTVEAATVNISGLQPGRPIDVVATQARLTIPYWVMTARWLQSDGESFIIRGGTFRSEVLGGTLEEGSFSLTSGEIRGTDITASGTGYRLWGEHASFVEDQLMLSGARVTTCLCPGDPAFVLAGDHAAVDLGEGSVLLTRGELRLGWFRVGLAEQFLVNDESLQRLSPPLVVEFDPAAADQSPRGRGLAVWIPKLDLGEGSSLELGLAGLDSDHPLHAWGVYTFEQDGISAVFGVTRSGGPRADFSVRRPVNDWLDVTFAINNRHYASQHYLHEGLVTLAATLPAAELASGGTLATSFTVTAAASSQGQAPDPVMAPRFRTAASFDWRLKPGPAGSFRLQVNLENTAYGLGRDQFGLRLRPAWSLSIDNTTFSLTHDWQLTNAASPFSTVLDRLAPINRSHLGVAWQADLSDVTRVSASAEATYNWLELAIQRRSGFETLLFQADVEATKGEWNVRTGVSLQLAGLLDPRPTPSRQAYLHGYLDADNGDVELGVMARHHVGGSRTDLEHLEFHAAYPLVFSRVKLVPFLALDVAPLLTAGAGPAVSGHGLIVEWDSCCGLFEIGYRLHGDTFSTTLSGNFTRD